MADINLYNPFRPHIIMFYESITYASTFIIRLCYHSRFGYRR